jgi:hypothetical protein
MQQEQRMTQNVTLYPVLTGIPQPLQRQRLSFSRDSGTVTIPQTRRVSWKAKQRPVPLSAPDKNGNMWCFWRQDFRYEDAPPVPKVIQMYERIAGTSESLVPDDEGLNTPTVDEEVPIPFEIINGQAVFSGIDFGDFELYDLDLPDNDMGIVFRYCHFKELCMNARDRDDNDIASSITLEHCTVHGYAYFSGRSYEKGLRIVSCRFLDAPHARLDLGAIYYGASGTKVYLANNHFEVFVDFFDAWLGDLTVINNFFLKGSNVFDPDEWLETDTRHVEGNTGEITLTEHP